MAHSFHRKDLHSMRSKKEVLIVLAGVVEAFADSLLELLRHR